MDKRIKFIIFIFLITLTISMPFSFALELNLTYDGNGNLIEGDGKHRTYNEFNQLIRVTDSETGDILETYIYHPTEDRILVKYGEYGGFNDPDEGIVYVNDNFVRKYTNIKGTPEVEDVYYIKDDSGIVAEEIRNVSYHGADYVLIKTLFYHNDHLGSTSIITNESGDLVEETFYSPYGEILEGGEVSRYDYEGKEFSSVTEDYDYNFRKYDPELGIFTQPDSGIQNVYDPQSLNRYRFERNNPYKYVDPDGKVVVIAGMAITYTVVEAAIDIISLTYSTIQLVKDPKSAVNRLSFTLDIIDLAEGPFSNPGPSGGMVHGGTAAWKHVGKHFGKKTGSQFVSGIGHYYEKKYLPGFNHYFYDPFNLFYFQPNFGINSIYFNSREYQIDQTKDSHGKENSYSAGSSYYYDRDSGGCVCRESTPEDDFWKRIGVDPNPPFPWDN